MDGFDGFSNHEATKKFFQATLLKSTLIPLSQRGIILSSPLWQRGVRGDFVKIFSLNWISIQRFKYIAQRVISMSWLGLT